MDRQAAEDYHVALLKRLHKSHSTIDRLIWIPVLSASGYYAFDSMAGIVFGGLLGYGICAILSTLDGISKEIWHADFVRHIHEHSAEIEAGKRMFDREAALDKALRRWWQF